MIAALKSEFRKLFTVRSTFILTALVVAIVMLVAFYVLGWRFQPADLHFTHQLYNQTLGALNIVVFGAVVAVLLMTHEYRYNTILYTFTSSNSRSKVLLAKFITVSVYALFLTVLIGVLTPLMIVWGVHAHGHHLVAQTIYYRDLIWRGLFYGWGYGMAGFLLAVLTRNQVASIVALFVVPDIIEQLLGLLLRHNTVYLPFHALDQVVRTSSGMSNPAFGTLSPGKGALIYSGYLAVGLIIAWVLFLRRDAN